jgi:hypothetical protein
MRDLSPFTPEQLARERRVTMLIAAGMFTALAIMFGLFIAAVEGRNIAERLNAQLYYQDQV